jgi:hypothetical protein
MRRFGETQGRASTMIVLLQCRAVHGDEVDQDAASGNFRSQPFAQKVAERLARRLRDARGGRAHDGARALCPGSQR